MKLRNNKGLVAMDMVLSILAILIFSVIIISMMYNNFLENTKIKKQALAIIYLTETLENVGIAEYDDITQDNINNGNIDLIPKDIEDSNYKIKIEVITNDLDLEENQTEEIVKKIRATISYDLGNKTYQHSMERIKSK